MLRGSTVVLGEGLVRRGSWDKRLEVDQQSVGSGLGVGSVSGMAGQKAIWVMSVPGLAASTSWSCVPLYLHLCMFQVPLRMSWTHRHQLSADSGSSDRVPA
jgi:hypothetical protein